MADSSSINAVSFSSERATKRFPSPRCASAIQIVRPLESIAEAQPKLQLEQMASLEKRSVPSPILSMFGAATQMEVELAEDLRGEGYTVTGGYESPQASVAVPGQNLPGSGSRKFPISYAVLASSFALGRDQAPGSRKSWTKEAAGKRVVIEIPNRCLACNSIV